MAITKESSHISLNSAPDCVSLTADCVSAVGQLTQIRAFAAQATGQGPHDCYIIFGKP